jgi:imidazolonepropionase-like amidohydrolase
LRLRRKKPRINNCRGSGTDTPSAPTYGNLPGLNGYLEMQQLHDAGLALEQIFRATTINNAREFKLDSQVGTIEPARSPTSFC